MIRKREGKWYLYTADGSKKLGGPYDTRDEAVKREKQVQYFKHKGKESESMPKSKKLIIEKAPKGRKPSVKEMGLILKLDALKVHEDEQALIDGFGDWADGSVSKCIEILTGKEGIDDPAPLCAWMKDQWSGSTDWRGDDASESAQVGEYGYDSPALGSMVPMGVYSFDALDQAEAAGEVAKTLERRLQQFQQMMINALWDQNITDKGMVLLDLIVGLQDRITNLRGADYTASSEAEINEAATVKSKVKAAIALLDDLLTEKSLPQGVILQVKGLRETFKRKWKDLEVGEAAPAQVQPQGDSVKISEFSPSLFDTGIVEEDSSVVIAEGDPKTAALYLNVEPIQAGWGNARDNHYYDEAFLDTNLPRLVGSKMYETDHKPNEKNNRTWVSTVVEYLGKQSNGRRLVKVGIHDPDFAQRVQNLAELKSGGKPVLDHLQCSIMAEAIADPAKFSKDGRTGKRIIELKPGVIDLDWVTHPGAGGHAVSIAESVNGSDGVSSDGNHPVKVLEEVSNMLEKTKVEEMVKGTKLHPLTQARLIAAEYESAEKLSEAITQEETIIKESTGSGQPAAMGESQPTNQTVKMTEAEYNEKMETIFSTFGLPV